MSSQPWLFEFLIPLLKAAAVVIYLMVMVIIMVWLERRLIGWMQGRLGPNRVGYQGVLQPIADTVKLLLKENIMHTQADWLLFNIAPVIVLVSALLPFCFIPFGDSIPFKGYTLNFWVAESPVGLLLVMGVSSLSVFALVFGGWGSNSKYPLLGGLRSVIQILSYEIPITLALLAVVFYARSLNIVAIVQQQHETGWNILKLPLVVPFFIFWICAVAETNRAPFDLPEAESELVAGFHTEYSGLKFAFFFMAEYTHMVLASSLAVVLFFGGWLAPFSQVKALAWLHPFPGAGVIWYFLKIMAFLCLYIWIRGTFPRYRFDELIKLAWKWMVPLALLNILVVALIRIWS